MGAWGVAVFSNDTAADVKADFRELLEDGVSPEEATKQLLARYDASVKDPDDRAFFWTGLAAAQYRLGRLQSFVKDRAVDAIDSGADLHLWPDPKDRDRRRLALLKLRAELLGPQRAPVTVRRPSRIPSPVSKGQTFLLQIGGGRQARFNVIGMEEHRLGDFPIIELVADNGRPYEERRELLGKVRWQRAQFELIPPRRSDLPGPSDLRVVGEHRTYPKIEPTRGMLGWSSLRRVVTRLLDDPDNTRRT